ncbi:hypothetical protein Bbelb_351310, partial [Branchiostoma belcheri]
MSRWHLQLCVKHAVHFQHGERTWKPRKNERVKFPPRKTRHVHFGGRIQGNNLRRIVVWKMRQDTTSEKIKDYQVYPEEQQCSCTCLQLMRPDKTPQDTGVSEQQCSCTCLQLMKPDKIPQDTEVSGVSREQQCSCTCLHQMRPDKIPQDTGVSATREVEGSCSHLRCSQLMSYPEEQQCSCTCPHQMRPGKTPQDTGVS